MKKKILSALLAVLCVFFTIGVMTVFRGCGAHDDGSFGPCYQARMAVFAMGFVMSAQALTAFAAKSSSFSAGCSLSLAFTALVAAFVPGRFISLCMMETMRCHMIMKPAVLVLGILIALLAAINAWLLLAGGRRENIRR